MKKLLSLILCLFGMFLLVGCDAIEQIKYGDEEQYKVYQLAKEGGYTGTYEEWLNTIKGEKGDQGEPGLDGVDGVSIVSITKESSDGLVDTYVILLSDGTATSFTVTNGEQGIQGEKGDQGIQGEKGDQGIQGEKGDQGIQGEKGDQGEQGKSAFETFKEYYPDYTGTEEEWITDVTMGNKCNLFGHSWDDGVITTEPTKGNEGEKTYSCENCDEHKYEVLPKIEVANAEIYEIDGVKYVNYGSYPQTHVGDTTLIAELNKLTETNDRGYYEYEGNEYAQIVANPYFSLFNTESYYQYSDGSQINSYITEWFKVEPIVWRIISKNNDGSYMLYSEYILDGIIYCNYPYLRNINDVDIYCNNYKYSNIRAWLNGYDGTSYNISDYTNKGFYDLAFKDSEKGAIIATEVDNSASTTDSTNNEYACENTLDKLYLLSYQDLKNSNYGFTEDALRYAKVTDYAKAIGVYWSSNLSYLNNGYYWLRSPNYEDSHFANYVYNDGSIRSNFVTDPKNGVRTACTINLE